jgi:M6 family metalloprotease-like protein
MRTPTAVLALSLAARAAAAQVYPTPLPDFAHLDAPHDAQGPMLTGCARSPRALLVIYRQFPDFTESPAVGVGGLRSLYFGGFPSVAGFFAAASFGQMAVSAARETQGADDDGVVRIQTMTLADYARLDDADGDGTVTEAEKGSGQPAKNREALEAADPFVDFAQFDVNGDGVVDDCELLLNHVTSRAPGADDVGRRGIAAGGDLDGKGVGFSVAMSDTGWGLFTDAHESMHVATHIRDLYGFGVGSFDIMGAPLAEEKPFLPSAWTRLHLGWGAPTVVTRDGYYAVPRADLSNVSFLLYDPGRGTDDYFLVENRRPGGSTYDQGASDDGLAIWRIDDRQYASDDEAVRPLEIMRPDGTRPDGCPSSCYAGSAIDAWDPSDPATPQRTMEAPWADGTPAGVAVRAISPAADTMTAYFDVRGPGILLDLGPAPAPFVTGRGVSLDVPLAVMNTGEEQDSFDFDFQGLAAGWTTRPAHFALGAGATALATPALTTSRFTLPGRYFLQAFGQSITDPGVRTALPLEVQVENAPPQCDAGGPYVAECRRPTPVVLDASRTTDFEGDPLGFSWSGPFAGGVATGSPAGVNFEGRGVFDVGLTVSDGFDQASCVTTVTVQDTQPPRLGTASPVTAECSSPAGASPSLPPPAVSDACDAAPALASDAAPPFALGTTTVTWTARDEAGLAATVLQTVTVVDTTAPVVTAPAESDVECTSPAGTPVSLGTATAADVCDPTLVPTSDAPALFPLGTTAVTWSAVDDSGNSGHATQRVTVRDTTPPALAVQADSGSLWPPDHKLVTIEVGVALSDVCDAAPRLRLVSVTSSEPEDGRGDGNTAPDVVGAALGTDDRSFQLRAERQGGGAGRTYTITYEAGDASGNTTSATIVVAVGRP